MLLAKLLTSGFAGCFCLLLPLVQVQITGSETLGGPREPHSNGAKQVCATGVIALPIICHVLGTCTCWEDCRVEKSHPWLASAARLLGRCGWQTLAPGAGGMNTQMYLSRAPGVLHYCRGSQLCAEKEHRVGGFLFLFFLNPVFI